VVDARVRVLLALAQPHDPVGFLRGEQLGEPVSDVEQ
jgi:hypothetical protein